MNVLTTRRAVSRRVCSFQASTSPTSSTRMARVGHARAASRRTSSSTLSMSMTSAFAKSPVNQSKAVGAIAMQLPAPTHTGRSIVTRRAMAALHRAERESRRLGARARADACIQGAENAADFRLAKVELRRDLRIGPTLGEKLEERVVALVELHTRLRDALRKVQRPGQLCELSTELRLEPADANALVHDPL